MKPCTFQLRRYRELAGFSVKELAFLLRVSPATIINYEKGRTFPSMDTVICIAHILGITTDQLLDYSVPQDEFSL